MSKVLVLSAHTGNIDRRIVAEMNTLATTGRKVTLVSVPTRLPEGGVDSRIRVIVPEARGGRRIETLSHLGRFLPAWVRDWMTAGWHAFGKGPIPVWTGFFLDAAPHDAYDAIHCHDLWTLPAAIELRKRYSPGAKLIYDSHELFPFQVNNRVVQGYLLKTERETIPECDLVITVNDSIADEMARLYGVPRPAVIWNSAETPPNGHPVDEQTFCDHFGCPREGFRVLFQGWFMAERNMKNLVRAFRKLDGSTRLLLLGGGPVESALRALCRRRRIRNVHFGPWAPQEKLFAYLRWAHLGIIPYRGDENLNNFYCTPNKLFEYIETRVPVCANDLPELRRILERHGTGRVYPMNGPDSIAAAVRDCRARQERGEFRPQDLEAARRTFGWSRQAAKLLELYRELGV